MESVEELFVIEAGDEGFFADARLSREAFECAHAILGEGPFGLLLKQDFEEGQKAFGVEPLFVFIARDAARDHRGGGRPGVERKFAENESDFARIDIIFFQAGIGLGMELRAMAAGH